MLSVLVGIGIFIVTWFYINSYYTLGIEDDLLSKITLIRHKVIKAAPQKNEQFVFISTGKDLNLVDDTAGYGNTPVSDRYKIYKLLNAINHLKNKPRFVLLDLQFYLPYTYSVDDSIQQKVKKAGLANFLPDTSIDDRLKQEIAKNRNLAVSVLLNNKNAVDTPLFKATYGIADYKTYGNFLNKFKLYYSDLKASSVPALLHQQINGIGYSGNQYALFCDHRLAFNYIWPDYYDDADNIKTQNGYQVYHIGSLMNLLTNPKIMESTFANKIVLVGNYEDDVHDTPAGKIPGTIILADIYLSLLNGRHYVPYLWIAFVIMVFSLLSYMAIYDPMPEVNFRFKFAFAEQVTSFVKEYISYIGILILVSLLSTLLFNITISLFLPAFIFSALDFLIQKKYKTKNEKN